MSVQHKDPVPVGKQGRQQLICELISSQPVHSQEELVELLSLRGVETTQTTLSRDLGELKVFKGPNGYALPDAVSVATSTTNELKRVLENLTVSIAQASSLVVLKTRPGRAQPIAYELDRSNLPLVVGTVCGDDTLFIATRSEADAAELINHLERLSGVQ
jgi:transcriptional regulator of arginine metabolism